eukprot:35426-Prorocentrum_minimum.AAC.1
MYHPTVRARRRFCRVHWSRRHWSADDGRWWLFPSRTNGSPLAVVCSIADRPPPDPHLTPS